VRVLIVAAAALVLAGAASTDLTPSKLTIALTDLSGAQLKGQGPVHERGYSAGYQRTFGYAKPSGQSGLVFVQSEALVAPTVARAANDISSVRVALTTAAGRVAFIASIAKNLKVKPDAVKPGALRSPRVGDSAVEVPLAVQLPVRRVYESILYVQLDRVVSVIVSAGIRSIAAAQTRQLAVFAVAHIDAALTPVSYAKPTVDGLAQVGSTLSAKPGTWSDATAKLSYRWQRCDPAGANCADIAGATTASYVVADADLGSTLRVEVQAANRFGKAAADSAVTDVVIVEAPPPPPPPGAVNVPR
jgi:hypothetical protein